MNLRFGPTAEESWIYSHQAGVYVEKVYNLKSSESPEAFKSPMGFYTMYNKRSPFSNVLLICAGVLAFVGIFGLTEIIQ